MLRKLLAHAAIVLSGMYIVFFFIDRVNSAMSFINNGITKRLLLALGLISIANAAYLIHDDRARVRRQQARLKEQRAARQREQRAARRPADGYSYRSRRGTY